MDPEDFRTRIADAAARVGAVVKGQEALTRLALVSLLARGHCLLEGPPGTAKTLLARCIANACDVRFGRIQFTPDLMPSDVIGVNIFDFRSSSFHLTKGPIFTDILLADEINRAPPKCQSALLQAMQEREATIDGETWPLGDDFFVIATQNPIEQHGTYPLPEAQLDRFLFKLTVDFPERDAEIDVVSGEAAREGGGDGAAGVTPVFDAAALAAARGLVDAVRLDPSIAAYVVDLVRATRDDPEIATGASTRAASALARAARAWAAMDGRDYVIPDDVQALFLPAMRHRIALSPAAEIEGRGADDVLAALVNRTDAPR
ncbi:AAA family ATPase [Rhodovulum sp. DZ06]|uniref:AAA family ATPase n=1 Tax=Rhodovulum sp. DZ06 TaxID=3425126 RepID=UPI003D33234D